LSITVTVRNNNLEQAMRVLKRKVQKEGIVKELRDRQFYKKPSEIRQEKIKQARKNWLKKQKKLEKIRGF
jgi:small subunit ribosomal protein S21|tara:strand:+ start:320 stop:529 length:210 start_codon:yes stop_codon:yes gene_type:complete